MAGKHYHHGNSPAAWTGVLIVMAGFGVGSLFTVRAEPLGVLGGAAIVALGCVVGLVMRAMGLGQAPAEPPRQIVRDADPEDAQAAKTSNGATADASATADGGGRAEPRSATVGG